MKKTILTALAAILIVLGIIIAMQPSEFYVSRSAELNAPADKVFAQVNDLKLWNDWSPWAKLDPNAKVTFAGPEVGKDSSMTWDGNQEVGKGTMTITESQPVSAIDFRLDFEKPMQATNTARFTFVPNGEKTTVTWSMSGHSNFVGKAIGLFMNCEAMVGGQFEDGLENLRSVVESAK